MKQKHIKYIMGLSIIFLGFTSVQQESIIEKVDQNMSSKNRIIESSMTIYGKRNSRTITAKTWSEGTTKSFTEYLSPISEKGTKMLKLGGQLWIYSPQTDRSIKISGNMLRQSVMGSDLSYEDMMDDRTLSEIYSERIVGNETIDNRNCIIISLQAKVDDVAYAIQKLWIDAERYVPLQQELFAKSGQLLKTIHYGDIKKIQGRWFPYFFTYKDMLKDGKGTEVRITSILFDQQIPEYIFSKAALKQ